MVGVDLSRFWDWHAQDHLASASLFLHPNDHPADSDLVEIDADDRIVRFHPYPHPQGRWLPNLVNAALYIIRKASLIRWRDAQPPLDFGKDLFPRMVEAGLVLRGYNSPEYIKDAGTPARLERVRKAYVEGVVERASLSYPQRAVFIDRDGTLNEDTGHVARAEDLKVFPFVGSALKRLNQSEWRAVVVTNQPVLARGKVNDAEMREIHARLDSEVAVDQAFFDRIYLCPHHPDRGFAGEVAALKVDCDCRKPKPGLILRAAQDLNVNLAESWFVGDSTADLGAAEQAGVSSILVRTGTGGLDEIHPFEPGFSQENFGRAVDFILDEYPKLVSACEAVIAALAPGVDIFIGGLARSGKSTVAATLAREWRRRKGNAVVVHLDRWILTVAKRGQGVLERYDLKGIANTVGRAKERASKEVLQIELPAYSRRIKQTLDIKRSVSLEPDTLVIWEGVVAIEIAARLGLLARSVMVETDEEPRWQRFLAYDRRRGITEQDSLLSWQAREKDEHPVILERGKFAPFKITLDGAFN